MPSGKFEWMQRLKAVGREHAAIRFATEHLLKAVQHDPATLGRNLRVRDVDEAAGLLEGTYLIRLFAEFETGLRKFWDASRGPPSPARTRDLLEGVGTRRRIPYDRIQEAHAVREYRNSLVHERDEDVDPIPLAGARSRLCHFLSFLPLQW